MVKGVHIIMNKEKLPDPKTWGWRVKKLNMKLQDFLKETGISRVAFYSTNPTLDTITKIENFLQSKEI